MPGIFLCATQTCDIGNNALLSQHLQRADLHQAQTGTNSEPSFPISAEKLGKKSPSCPCDLALCSPPASPTSPLSVPSPPLAPATQTPARQEVRVLLCVQEGLQGRGEGVGYFPTMLRGVPTDQVSPSQGGGTAGAVAFPFCLFGGGNKRGWWSNRASSVATVTIGSGTTANSRACRAQLVLLPAPGHILPHNTNDLAQK